MVNEALQGRLLTHQGAARLSEHLPQLQVSSMDTADLQQLASLEHRVQQLSAKVVSRQHVLAVLKAQRDEAACALRAAESHMRTSKEHMQALTEISNLCKQGSSAAAGTAMVPGAAQLPVFEAYVHPQHPGMLVTPGTLVFLLLLEMVRLGCAHMSASDTQQHACMAKCSSEL
jgi:TolA-binding protein